MVAILSAVILPPLERPIIGPLPQLLSELEIDTASTLIVAIILVVGVVIVGAIIV